MVVGINLYDGVCSYCRIMESKEERELDGVLYLCVVYSNMKVFVCRGW